MPEHAIRPGDAGGPWPAAVTDLAPATFLDLLSRQVPTPGQPSTTDWLLALPQLLTQLQAEWGLRVSGPARHGYTSLVLPVESASGPAALKLVWPHPEGSDEPRVLRTWGGDHAVRLLAADPRRWALLLERLDPRDLNGPPVGVLESCEIIGALAVALDRPAPPWVSLRASDFLNTLVADIETVSAGPQRGRLPRRLLERGRSLAADLRGEPGIDARLVHSDLHQENVLWRPDPGQWVAIDPQTIAADPAWVVAPAMWNRWAETAAAHDARVHLNLRLETLCEAAGLDPARARAFTEVRLLRNALWDILEEAATTESLTRDVTLIKAFQPE